MIYEGVFLLIIFLTFVGTVLWLALRGLEHLMHTRAPLFAHVAAMLAFVLPIVSPDRIWISVKNDWMDGFRLAACVWLWGAVALGLILLMMRVISYIGVSRSPLCRDRRLLAIFDGCVRKVHVHRPTLRCRNLRTTACVCLAGIQHTVIVNPDMLADFDDEKIEQVLLHELTHIARGHLWLGMLFDILCCLHWMNPFAWLSRRSSALRCEQDCDARVVFDQRGIEPSAYMHTIILTLQSSLDRERRTVHWLCGSARFSQYRFLKNRFESLMHPASPRKRFTALCLSLALIVSVVFFSVSTSKAMLDSRYPAAGNPSEIEYAFDLQAESDRRSGQK